ncbi:hypothetical protein ID866_8475 [Astraeus odoratus]|nr:hypothetical protein ID866_8475 [Astraeus odoratus]
MSACGDSVQRIHQELDNLLNKSRGTLSPTHDQLSSLVAAFLPSHPPTLHSKAYLVLSTFCQATRSSASSGGSQQGEDGSDAGTESLSRIFQPFITSRLSESTDSDTLAGVSFLSALFQVDRRVASHVFLQEGFVDLLSTLIVSPSPPGSLEVARLFAHASGHKACRGVIPDEIVTWLRNQSIQTGDRALRAAAILALVKLSRGTASNTSNLAETHAVAVEPRDEFFTNLLTEMITSESTDRSFINDAVEGLSYLSTNPVVKQSLADTAFLRVLFGLISKRKPSAGPHEYTTILYGILLIASNLCAYKPRLSKEQQQMAKLRKFAEGGKQSDSKNDELSYHPMDIDKHVQARCHKVIESGVLDILTVAAGVESPASKAIVGHIYLNLVEDNRNRGKVLQSGGAKNLVRVIKAYLSSTADSLPSEVLIPIQALAKLAITSSPIQVFGPNEGNMLDAIRPFSHLILHTSSSTLQQFEALMALTNLASYNPACASKIASTPHLLNKIELLLLEDHILVRRASCELICNLIAGSDDIFARYGGEGGGQSAKSKVQVLLAMSDVEDLPTRVAASGALAMLTSVPNACRIVFDLQREHRRAFSVIAQLIDPSVRTYETDDEDTATPETGDARLVHRSVVCFRNILDADKALPRMELAEETERVGLFKIFARLLKGELGSYDSTIMQSAAEATKKLVELAKLRSDDNPIGLRRRIDEAFEATATASKRDNEEVCTPGGFIVDGAESTSLYDEEPGGFLVPEEGEPSHVRDSTAVESYIPLTSVPHALSLLSLEPDDEVLAVFRNAATGWGARTADSEGVNRKDWRAVCAVLLEDRNGPGERAPENADFEMDEDSGSEGDEYELSSLSSEQGEGSSDEYKTGGSSTVKSKQARSESRRSPSKASFGSKLDTVHLTAEQKAQCREDFARFFPSTADAQLDIQRITAQEVINAANLLKEKLKPEEASIRQRRASVSRSSDGSMTIEDFERMIVQLKMVQQ